MRVYIPCSTHCSQDGQYAGVNILGPVFLTGDEARTWLEGILPCGTTCVKEVELSTSMVKAIGQSAESYHLDGTRVTGGELINYAAELIRRGK